MSQWVLFKAMLSSIIKRRQVGFAILTFSGSLGSIACCSTGDRQELILVLRSILANLESPERN